MADDSVIRDSAPSLLHLLLLAELFVRSSPRPAHHSLCGRFMEMFLQLNSLENMSKNLHHLTDNERMIFEHEEHRLDDLPHIQHNPAHVSSLKMNESLSRLLLYTRSFKLRVDWLKTAKENVSLSSEATEGAAAHLLQLSNLLNTSLLQMGEEVPSSRPPPLASVSTAFDVLRFSVEVSERLLVFSDWSKRVLASLQRRSGCPRH
ncbi:uncharacterized protein il11b [Pungitius pungitius]|uniref:uncharacterized protein il11b n=1 Tax=Pungitius pungitius TaxID=134920 RepID=UPI002E14408A